MKCGLTFPCSFFISIETNSARETYIKSRTYYFLDDMINIKDLGSHEIKRDKKLYKSIFIYYIEYLKPNSVKPL